MNIPFDQLGFVGILQVTLLGVCVFVGISLLFFQRMIGLMFVLSVLALLTVVALAVGYSGSLFASSLGAEALSNADPSKVQSIHEGAAAEAKLYWTIAGLNVAALVLLALIAGAREFFERRLRS